MVSQPTGRRSSIKMTGSVPMIRNSSEEAFSPEWVETNITNPVHDLVIIREIIPWKKIAARLCQFYNKSRGASGKSLRMMTAVLIVMKYYQLSGRHVADQIKENRYIQYFCNVSDTGLQVFLHHTSLCIFRKRIGEEGIAIIEKEVFETLRRAGIIRGGNALIDSGVPENKIIHPNDVHLIFRAFKKMKQFAKLHNIPVWWDTDGINKMWRAFNLTKGNDRAAWLIRFNMLFIPALTVSGEKIGSLQSTQKRKTKAAKMLKLLNLPEEQTVQKIKGEMHIKNRIVSIDEPDARPVKKGKIYPDCGFGTAMQMTFSREGFMITAENFIGSPNDKTLFPGTVALFKKRMKKEPDTVVTGPGFRSSGNFKAAKDISSVFLGRSADVSEEKQEFCRKSRSAAEGFTAVAKNLRGFGCSLYRGLKGDRIWSLLCQTAYNLKKFIQLWRKEEIGEEYLTRLNPA